MFESLSLEALGFVLAGATLAGFVNGLAGFGTALTALGFWLHVMDPLLAGPLVVTTSLMSGAEPLYRLRRTIVPSRLLPFVLPGILGVPLGVLGLTHVDPEPLRGLVGAFLMLYAGVMLVLPGLPAVAWGGRGADGAVGFAGGILGGLIGMSGALPTVWAGLRGWTKNDGRCVYQPFSMVIFVLALVGYALGGVLTWELIKLTLICLPCTLLASRLGLHCYGRIHERHFTQLILVLLMASGLLLVVQLLLR